MRADRGFEVIRRFSGASFLAIVRHLAVPLSRTATPPFGSPTPHCQRRRNTWRPSSLTLKMIKKSNNA